MLIGLALNGCYNTQEKEAIEVCKKSCKYPLTFEVIETSSTSYPASIDTITLKECYINRPPADFIDTIVNEGYGRDLSSAISESFRIIDNRIDEYGYYIIAKSGNFRIDSICTYTTKRYYPGYELFKVTYSGKNDFGVPCLDSSEFLIINDQILGLDNNDWWDSDVANNIETLDTISISRFINNSPDKIFKSGYEINKYLNNFESNFKLKN